MRGSSIAVQPAPKRPRSAAARVRLPPRLLAYLQRWQRRRCVPFCRRMERRAGAAHQQSIPACPGGRRLGGRCGTAHIEAHGDHLAGAAWGAGSRDLWIFWHTPDMSVCTVTITRTARPTLSTRYVVPDRNPTDIPQPNANKRPQRWSNSPEIIELFGRFTRSGRGGRRFKSCHSDHSFPADPS